MSNPSSYYILEVFDCGHYEIFAELKEAMSFRKKVYGVFKQGVKDRKRKEGITGYEGKPFPTAKEIGKISKVTKFDSHNSHEVLNV